VLLRAYVTLLLAIHHESSYCAPTHHTSTSSSTFHLEDQIQLFCPVIGVCSLLRKHPWMDIPSAHRNYLVLLVASSTIHIRKRRWSRQECRSTVLTCVEWSAYFQVTKRKWRYSHSVAGGVRRQVWFNENYPNNYFVRSVNVII